MKLMVRVLCSTMLFSSLITPCLAINTIFYTDRSNIIQKLNDHHQQIDMVIIQAYFTNILGELAGGPNINTIKKAHEYHIPVLAQLTNYQFDRQQAHLFLTSITKQNNLIALLVQKSIQLQLDGIQLDFENIDTADKNLFNRFAQNLAYQLHKNKLLFYVAVIPPLNFSNANRYYKAKRQFWSGVYDLSFLIKVADKIDLMTYDQHSDYSTPGPVAGLSWARFVVNHTLKSVPKEKVILGIPAYSSYWQIGNLSCNNRIMSVNKGDQISFMTVQKILRKYHPSIFWHPIDKIYFALFSPDNLYRYLFIEDARAMAAMLELAKQYQLSGVSVFRLGLEDPAFWSVLVKH